MSRYFKSVSRSEAEQLLRELGNMVQFNEIQTELGTIRALLDIRDQSVFAPRLAYVCDEDIKNLILNYLNRNQS